MSTVDTAKVFGIDVTTHRIGGRRGWRRQSTVRLRLVAVVGEGEIQVMSVMAIAPDNDSAVMVEMVPMDQVV